MCIRDSQKIVFNGNGYAPEWEKEAKRRGLPILPSMVDAIPAPVSYTHLSSLCSRSEQQCGDGWNERQR